MAAVSQSTNLVALLTQSLDEAVEEVFRLMMAIRCHSVDECPLEEREMISSIIGLAGAVSGICVLCSGEAAAVRMTEMLTHSSNPVLSETVKDAIGEICNMIAGAWKAKLPSLATECMLSTPTVITGTNYQLHYQKPDFRIERFYSFEDRSFAVVLLCESAQ